MEEKDDLERFILENRDELDDLTPGNDLWAGIENQLGNQQPPVSNDNQPVFITRSFFWKAAAIMIAVTASLIMLLNRPAETKIVQVKLSDISPEYAEIENYYSSMVSQRMDLIKKTPGSEEFLNAVVEELKSLDQEYEALTKEMGDNLDQQVVIQAMIEIHKSKLKILKESYDILNEQNSYQNEGNKEI